MQDQAIAGEALPVPSRPIDEAGEQRTESAAIASQGALLPSTAQLGLWIFLATVTMLFAAFSSAYIVRGTRPDWQQTAMPSLLWLNTAVLLASSATLEVARARRWAQRAPAGWLLASALLGAGFFLGQLTVWRQLADSGVYVQTNPFSSFFYILTGLHGLHLLGGLALLFHLLFSGIRARQAADARKLQALRGQTELCATYWHFLGALWIYLFFILFLR